MLKKIFFIYANSNDHDGFTVLYGRKTYLKKKFFTVLYCIVLLIIIIMKYSSVSVPMPKVVYCVL